MTRDPDDNVPDDERGAPCPECGHGRVVPDGYERDTNTHNAHCSDRCGWEV